MIPLGRRGGLTVALMAAQVIYGTQRLSGPRATRSMLSAILATSGTEAVEARGRRRGGAVFGVAGLTGFGSELLGVRTGIPFGRYSYSDRLGPRLGGVPMLAAGAWAAMARPAWIAAGWIRPRRRARVLLAASALTAWDVYLDPRMAREGYWHWEAPGRYAGIPVSNFVGWWITAALVFGIVSQVDPHAPTPGDDAALVLYVWTWMGEAFANAAFWDQPRVAGAGGVAMGAFALPALAARLRRGRR